MCFKKIIKNYFFTISFIFILGCIFSFILINQHVEGASECHCRSIKCTTKPSGPVTCNNTTPCSCPVTSYTICTNDWGEKCTSDSGGCCYESDCSSEHNGKGCNICQGCVTKKPLCTGVPGYCGHCDFEDS